MKNLIFFVFLSINIYAQESTELFLKYIPDKFRNSENDISTIQNILDAIPEINLDLYFYFIEALELDDINENQNGFKKFLNQFNYEKYKQKIAFTNWNEEQINIILNSDLEEDIKKKGCSNFYSSNSLTDNKDSLTNFINPDSNKISYYKVVYYSNSNLIDFDSTEHYSESVNAFEEAILNKFRKIQNEIKSKTYRFSDDIPLFDSYKKNWYLFYYKLEKNDELHNYVLDCYKNNFSIDENFSNWTLSFNYNYNSLSSFEEKINTNSPFIKQLNEDIKINQFGISVGYRHKLKKQKSIFSYINFDLSFAYGKSYDFEKLEESKKTLTTFSENLERTNIYELSFPYSNNKISSLSYLGLSISTPIYYIMTNLEFSLGSTVYLNVIDYKLDYKYKLKSTYIMEDITTNEIIDVLMITSGEEILESKKTNKIGINPFASFDYSFFQKISVEVRVWFYYQSGYIKVYF